MEYISEYYIKSPGDTGKIDKFYMGDNVSIYKENISSFTGTITLITSKGIYLDVGSKKDKYFRLDEIDKISKIN